MTPQKLRKLRAELESLRRRGGVTAVELRSLAEALGRERYTGRGKEPIWIQKVFGRLRPLSIPDHRGRDLRTGTKKSILNQLEEDLDAWETLVHGD